MNPYEYEESTQYDERDKLDEPPVSGLSWHNMLVWLKFQWETVLYWRRLAHHDFSIVPWGLVGKTTAWFIWTCGVFVICIILGVLGQHLQTPLSTNSACQPDGNFNLYGNAFTQWHTSGFFQITLAFGQLDFTEAKAIDIAWDIAIGRGGQFLLAYLSWIAFSDYVATCLVTTPVTFSTFFTIFLEREVSLTSLYSLTGDFFRRRRLQSSAAMAAIVLSAAFVIAWPTLAGAMTGYTPLNIAYIQNGSSLVRFSDYQLVAYVIHDGDRIKLDADYVIPAGDLAPTGGDPIVYASYIHYGLDDLREKHHAYWIKQQTSLYVGQYGFSGTNQNSSKWADIDLSAPVLNVTSSFVNCAEYINTTVCEWDWDTGLQAKPHPKAENTTYLIPDTQSIISAYELTGMGVCKPADNLYQWGFSFLQLFIDMILLFIWSICVATMWIRAQRKLPLRGLPEVPKGWAAVLILSEAIELDLKDGEIEADGKTDRELKRNIKQQRRGGAVSFCASLTPKQKVSTPWNRWWWLVLAVSCTSILAPIFVEVSPYWYGFAPGLTFTCLSTVGCMIAMAVGRSLGSKIFIYGASLLAAAILALIALFVELSRWRHIY